MQNKIVLNIQNGFQCKTKCILNARQMFLNAKQICSQCKTNLFSMQNKFDSNAKQITSWSTNLVDMAVRQRKEAQWTSCCWRST